MSSVSTPLCVDLDGTLINSDTLIESIFLLLKQNPLTIFCMFIWLFKGKSFLKHKVSERVQIDATCLPYNTDLIKFIQEEKKTGREIWLCTAANEKIANAVANHINLFDKVLASNELVNLSSINKAEALITLAYNGFDYAGNHTDDLKVWHSANNAVIVNLPQKHRHKITKPIIKEIYSKTSAIKSWIKELRVHQWAKNCLIFVPLIMAFDTISLPIISQSIVAFFSFSFAASSVYLLNDLIDLETDRVHSTKKYRPLACGAIPLMHGCIAAVLLLVIAFILASLLPLYFILTLILYYSVTLAYSFLLKRKVILDVVTLATLYSFRLIAGAAAIGTALSSWLIAFSMFLFFSLAIVKRVVELRSIEKEQPARSTGRGYYPTDIPILLSSGIASGYISILVFVLYIDSFISQLKYSYPHVLYLIAPLLFVWLTLVWFLTWRDQMPDDPVIFALKNRTSQFLGVVMGILFAIAVGV